MLGWVILFIYLGIGGILALLISLGGRKTGQRSTVLTIIGVVVIWPLGLLWILKDEIRKKRNGDSPPLPNQINDTAYLFWLKDQSIQLPLRCINCLGPTDMNFIIRKGRTEREWRSPSRGLKKWDEGWVEIKESSSLELPYCASCNFVANKHYPMETIMNILKYAQIPFSLVGAVLGTVKLSLTLSLPETWYWAALLFGIILGLPIALYFLFNTLAARSAPFEARLARDPAGFVKSDPGINGIYIRNRGWAELFGNANNISVGETKRIEFY